MAYTEANKRAIDKYRQSEKGKALVKEYSKNGRIQVQFNLSTKSEIDVISAIDKLPVPKGQYAKTAFIDALVRDGYLKQQQ